MADYLNGVLGGRLKGEKDLKTIAWEKQREPCPTRVIEDVGGGFALGCFLSTIWQGGKGLVRPQPEHGGSWRNAIYNVSTTVPKRGGDFAMWCCAFASCECCLAGVRKTDDMFNSIAGGFAAGSLMAWKSGWGKMLLGGAFGGVFLAAIELAQRMAFRAQALGQLKFKHNRVEKPGSGMFAGVLYAMPVHATRQSIKDELRFIPTPPNMKLE